MNVASIINDWKNKQFKTIYWLEGEEDYFIDEVMAYAEKEILSPADASFNLTVFYGRDADWAGIVNACRRYPMFADRQVVLLKEAQQMRDIEKLEAYIENPSPSTLLVVSYKGKTLDGRTRLSKILKKQGEVLTTRKIYDHQLLPWIRETAAAKGFSINDKALHLLAEHIGNDLSRIVNELDKLSLNVEGEKNITENDIEKYIGISKEYNIFELQKALSKKDAAAAIRIIQYFEANPKAVPAPLIIPSLYGYFSKIMPVYFMTDKSERSLRPLFYNNPALVEQVQDTLKNYSYLEIEKIILLLHHANLKLVGIDTPTGIAPASFLKEMSYKILNLS